MMRTALPAVLLASAVTAAPATPPTSEGETVSVFFAPLQIVCTGVCPWFDAQVDPQGRVTVRQFGLSDEREEVVVQQITSFLASPAQATAFRAALAPLRPTTTREVDRRCARLWQPASPRGFFIQPRNDDIRIVWRSGGRSIRLTACRDNLAFRSKVQRAVVALGLYIDGRRPDSD